MTAVLEYCFENVISLDSFDGVTKVILFFKLSLLDDDGTQTMTIKYTVTSTEYPTISI